MRFSRRGFLGGLALAGPWCGAARASQDRSRNAPEPRLSPSLCLYSRILAKIDHNDLPMVLRGLGFDGCDLSVEPGGHVAPGDAGNYLMPALEALTGAGLEAAVISTSLTAGNGMAREVLGLAGVIGVPLFRPGRQVLAAPGPQLLGRVTTLVAIGRANNMAMAISNTTEPGGSIAEMETLIHPLDARWVGYDFDPAAASARGGADAMAAAFRLARPRLKMVSARDLRPGALTPCPLGEGVVDWPLFFKLLAEARFTGPISLRIEYQPKEELEAIRHDLAFLRAQLEAKPEANSPYK